MFTTLIFHDGRNDYLTETLTSFNKKVKFPDKNYKILLVDNPTESEEDYTKIKKKFKIDEVIVNEKQLGIFGNVQKGWSLIPEGTKYIFHLENDFTFNEDIDISFLQKPLDINQHIYQVALLRQPWYQREINHGNMYKSFGQIRIMNAGGVDLVGQKNHFTHNPSLYRADIVKQLDNYNEYSFIQHIIKNDPKGICCYLGTIKDKAKVNHIGEFKKDGRKSAEC